MPIMTADYQEGTFLEIKPNGALLIRWVDLLSVRQFVGYYEEGNAFYEKLISNYYNAGKLDAGGKYSDKQS